MSARLLTAYLVSVGLAAGIISQALAKPPDLPAKVQVNCDKCSDKLILKTYQVADLVVPIESAPWPDLAGLPPLPEATRAPEPVPAYSSPPVQMIPQPFGLVTLPARPPAPYMPVPFPVMTAPIFGIVKSSANEAPKACCPACANANCNNCCPAKYCEAPACVAAGCASAQVQTPKKTLEDQLIRLIVNTVRPESWDVNGGRGTIDYFLLGMAVTVNQTPEIQAQVAELLAALRRLQDEQIAVEVRVISVPQGLGEKAVCKILSCSEKCEGSCADVVINARETASGSVMFGVGVNSDTGVTGPSVKAFSCPGCCLEHCQDSKQTAKLSFLSDAQAKKFMDDLQANPKTNVMMTPKVTVFNGQASTINVTEPQFFVTNVKAYRQGDRAVFIPENQPLPTGFHFSVKPTVSQDHRFVQMAYEIEETRLDSASDHVPLFPVSMFAKPIFEDGSNGDSVPFTMYLQQPTLLTQRVHQEVVVPCGRTVLFKSWTRSPEVREESEVPVLSNLPYIGDMFKNVSYHRETEDVWIMITPRILVNEQEEVRPPAAAAGPTVTDNLHKLQQAKALLQQADHCCHKGQADSARRIYERVVELCPGSRYAQLAERHLMPVHAPDDDQSEEICTIINGKAIKKRVSISPEQKKNLIVLGYLENYWQACAEGRMSEATQWAVQALALDPACFSKAREAGWQKTVVPAVAPSAN